MNPAADLTQLVESIAGTKIAVIGDVMLDRFVRGDATRISPEGPVPVLAAMEEMEMPGGAGNVISNLAALGAHPSLIALIGEDEAGARLAEVLAARHADLSGLIRDGGRPTAIKTRFVARGQQLLRTDQEKAGPVSDALADRILAALERTLDEGAKALVLSDYGKGVLRDDVIRSAIALAKARGVPVLADPKGTDFSRYRGATLVSPNRKELHEASAMPTKSDAEVEAAGLHIIESCGIQAVVATRSEDGMTLVNGADDILHLRTQVREVFDVSGAGDTVIATLAAALGAGSDLRAACALANKAGGIVVGKLGTATVSPEELLADDGLHDPHQAALVSWEQARDQVRRWQNQGLKVGFTNGCFDILHIGHVSYLNEARRKCDRLVMGLNHDQSVRLLKGPERPINPEKARAGVIGALSSIDLVILFGAQEAGEDNTPCALIDLIRPDIFFKGGDYTIDQLPEAKTVQAYGGEVQVLCVVDGYSTTGTIAKMKATA